MGLIFRALLGWVGTVGSGWMVSDIYNEQQRKKQLALQNQGQQPSILDTAKETLKSNWGKYAIVAVIAVIALFLLNRNKK